MAMLQCLGEGSEYSFAIEALPGSTMQPCVDCVHLETTYSDIVACMFVSCLKLNR